MRGENGTESLVLHVHDNSLDKMSKLNIYKTKSKKVKMKYSCHGRYKGIHLVFSLFSLHPGQGQNDQLFGGSLVSVKSIEIVTSTQEQVQEYCNWRKEALFRL